MKRAISLILTVSMVLSLGILAALAEDTVYLAYDGAGIYITSEGYRCGEYGELVPFTGRYVFYGYWGEPISIQSEGTFDITLHQLELSAPAGGPVIKLNAPSTVNLSFAGYCVLKANYADCIADASGGSCTVTFDFAENSGVLFDNYDWAPSIYPVSPSIKLTMADGSAVEGSESWGGEAVTLSSGEISSHSYDYKYGSAEECQYFCTDCDEVFETYPHSMNTVYNDEGHGTGCIQCNHMSGESTPHCLDFWIDGGESCILGCRYCGYEESTYYSHVFKEYDIEASDYEAAHLLTRCENCGKKQKEYTQDADMLVLELYDDVADGWNGASIGIFEGGLLVKTLTTESSAEDGEVYALPLDKDSGYSLKLIAAGGYPEECGIQIKTYIEGQYETVYSLFGFSELEPLDTIFEMEKADYDGLQEALALIPLNLEYYTSESLMPLVEAVGAIIPDLPVSQQDKVDAMEKAVRDALLGLEEQDGELVLHGIINASYGDIEITSDGYWCDAEGHVASDVGLEYSGKYILLGTTVTTPSEHYVFIDETAAEVDIVNFNIMNPGGAVIVYLGKLELGVYGYNYLSCAGGEYAGIELYESELVIKDTDGVLYAIGSYNCAGIGSYGYDSDEPDGSCAGDITINGNTVYAFGNGGGAGIGGGMYGNFGTITINGGTIHAECIDGDGAGIGVGYEGIGGDIIINGGNITALSLTDDGAGIGGSNYGYVDSITVNGGSILVGSDDGAGLGAGQEEDSLCGNITINGGVIAAHAGHDNDENLVGMGYSGIYEAYEGNQIIINGGAIVTNGIYSVVPLPVDGKGNEINAYGFHVNNSLANKAVTLELASGEKIEVTPVGTYIEVYTSNDDLVINSEALICDVNGDMVLDVFDYFTVKSICMETIQFTEDEFSFADVNGDGSVDVFDYYQVKTAYFNK